MTGRRTFLTGIVAVGIAAARPGLVTARTGARGTAETVLGPIDASRLGFTLPHEHIADGPSVLGRWPSAWGGRESLVERSVDHLRAIKAAGISTVVDLTTYDVGRDIRFLEEVSRKSGLNIIACTGQRFFPPHSPDVSMPARTIAGLAGFFMEEIERGIDGTDIKAGVIKMGIVDNRLTALEAAGLRAAVRASKATGVPVRIHTDSAHRAAEGIAALLEEEGMNPTRVSFDHSDDSGNMDYFVGLLERGYSLGMDHVHRGFMANFKPAFEARAGCIKQLIGAGFADRLFLSSDSELGGALLPQSRRDWRESIDPPDGMLFCSRRLIPYLKQIGVTDRDVDIITVDNPKRFFSRN